MAREVTNSSDLSELMPAADIVRRFIGISARLSVGAKQAGTMASELQAYGGSTEPLRASLTPDDQPANFAAALSSHRPLTQGAPR